MKNENASDLFGNSIEEVDCHECGRDTQENQSINFEDRKRMLFLLTHQEKKNKNLPLREAQDLVNEFI